MSKQTRKFRKFEAFLQERLRDPEYARIFLDVALEEYEKDSDRDAFLLALRDVVEAQGGIGKLAKEPNLNRQNLYKALSLEIDSIEIGGAVMRYYIYHDKVTPAAKLHLATCGACKGGRGMHGHQNIDENEWYGPFGSKQEALQAANLKGIGSLLKNCGLCKP